MADRGRDLKLSIVSDLDKFRTDDAADDLDRLGKAAGDAGRDVKDAGRDIESAYRNVGHAGSDLERAGDRLDNFGDDAKTTARRVDTAFDSIARSAKSNLDRDVKRATDDGGHHLRDMGDEAGQTAREMAASFSSGGDIGDALQELAANAPTILGPLGTAAGVAAGVGIGMITASAQKLQQQVSEMVSAMIDAGGKLNEEYFNQKLAEMAQEDAGRLEELRAQADLLGLSFYDLAQASVGNSEALGRVETALDGVMTANQDTADAAGNYNSETAYMRANVAALRKELEPTRRATELAEAATRAYSDATSAASSDTESAAQTIIDQWDGVRAHMADPVRGKVTINGPSATELAAIRANAQAWLNNHPNVVRVRAELDDMRFRP